MKTLLVFIVKLLTLPFIATVLLVLSLIWLGMYCWGIRDENHMPTNEIKSVAYLLWHFKVKKDD